MRHAARLLRSYRLHAHSTWSTSAFRRPVYHHHDPGRRPKEDRTFVDSNLRLEGAFDGFTSWRIFHSSVVNPLPASVEGQ